MLNELNTKIQQREARIEQIQQAFQNLMVLDEDCLFRVPFECQTEATKYQEEIQEHKAANLQRWKSRMGFVQKVEYLD